MGTKSKFRWNLLPVEQIDTKLFLYYGRYLPHITKEQREYVISLPSFKALDMIHLLRNHLYYRKAKDGRPYKPKDIEYIQRKAAQDGKQ